jgi:hypothetical protein
MNTSYYFSNKIKPEQNLIKISVSHPKSIQWLQNVRIYRPFCPPWDLVQKYKNKEITENEYVEMYYSLILNFHDPLLVYKELGEDAILLCWEKPDIFCHRHIVAEWFKSHLNIDINEL